MQVEPLAALASLRRKERQQNPLVTKADITRIEAFHERIRPLLLKSIGRFRDSGPIDPSEVRGLLQKLDKNRADLAVFLQEFFALFTSPETAKEEFGTYILRKDLRDGRLKSPLAIQASGEEVDNWVRTGRSKMHRDFLNHLERYLITSFKNIKNTSRLTSELPNNVEEAAGVLLVGPHARSGCLIEVLADTAGLLVIQVAAPAPMESKDQLDRIPDFSRFLYLQNKAAQNPRVRFQVYRATGAVDTTAAFLLGQLIPKMRKGAKLYLAGFENSDELVKIWEGLRMPNKPFAAYFQNEVYDLGESVSPEREDSASWVPSTQIFEDRYRWLTDRSAMMLPDADWRALGVPALQEAVVDMIENDLSSISEQRGLLFAVWAQWWAVRKSVEFPERIAAGSRAFLERAKMRLGYSDYWYADLRSAMRTDYYQVLFGRVEYANTTVAIYDDYTVPAEELNAAQLEILAQAVPEWSREAPFSAFTDFLRYDSELRSAHNIAVIEWKNGGASRYIYVPNDDDYVFYLLRAELQAIDRFVENPKVVDQRSVRQRILSDSAPEDSESASLDSEDFEM